MNKIWKYNISIRFVYCWVDTYREAGTRLDP